MSRLINGCVIINPLIINYGINTPSAHSLMPANCGAQNNRKLILTLDQPVTRPLYPDRADTIVYAGKGTVHCVCLATGTQRDLAFQGFEADRNTLKYRCPAAAYGLDCQAQCHTAGQLNSYRDLSQQKLMTPARGTYCLKTGSDEFFRYSAPKIVKCRVSEPFKKIIFETKYPPLFRQ